MPLSAPPPLLLPLRPCPTALLPWRAHASTPASSSRPLALGTQISTTKLLYETFIPFILGTPLDAFMAKAQANDPADWRTPMYSESTAAWRCLTLTMRFLLRHWVDASPIQVKLFKWTMRKAMVDMALGDLRNTAGSIRSVCSA